MNAAADRGLVDALTLDAIVGAACARVAPNWPLDQLIAVNPWWGWRNLPITEAAARLAHLCGARILPSRELFRHWWNRGAFARRDIETVLASKGSALSVTEVLAWMNSAADEPARLPLIVDLADRDRDLDHAMSWSAFVTHNISQQCAAYFDHHQASWRPDTRSGLYAAWHAFVRDDPSPAILMGDRGVRERLRALPGTAEGVLQQALPVLGFGLRDEKALEAYFVALFGSIGGWAAWASYQQWQAGLMSGHDTHQRELLAIRLAWEWVLQPLGRPGAGWTSAWARDPAPIPAEAVVLQDALERAMHAPLSSNLQAALAREQTQPAAEVLAVFCIDVRSEPFRRALEAASPRVRTSGFAGFFGLPIAYTPLGAAEPRPQLPGLLAAQRQVADEHDDVALGQKLAQQRRRQGEWRKLWDAFRASPASAFTFVEACGWTASKSLVEKSLALPSGEAGTPGLRPRLQAAPGVDAVAELAARADMLAGVLGAMGLARADLAWPSIVLLAGHGSRSANNPFAAGLDCGACGGQTGEANARVLASLLNAPELRAALAQRGIAIPAGTWFVAALHCTTTDEVELYDVDTVPQGWSALIGELGGWLSRAGDEARAERSASLGLPAVLPDADRSRRIQKRSRDWAQVRPEWALANNMAFIAAPRARTSDMNLAGRAFLHDYDWRNDPGFGVLELLITAPLVVANWINLQYHASCVDPQRYGSGNKVLHNVVGGRIGVFEGNGGDLRIGLPWQSVHDGERWMHAPLRLAAYFEAPRDAIETILQKHEAVRQLVEHGWLHLHCMEPGERQVLRRDASGWSAAVDSAAAR